MLYHVTDKDVGIKIWNEGLKSNSTVNNNRMRRKSMRKHVDKVASENYDNYVPRQNAIFAWTTFNSAVRYAERYPEPAIVEFDLNGPAWCVESDIAEDLYSSYDENYTDEDILKAIFHYREWYKIRNSELEVWFQESSVNEICRVVDDYGNPL